MKLRIAERTINRLTGNRSRKEGKMFVAMVLHKHNKHNNGNNSNHNNSSNNNSTHRTTNNLNNNNHINNNVANLNQTFNARAVSKCWEFPFFSLSVSPFSQYICSPNYVSTYYLAIFSNVIITISKKDTITLHILLLYQFKYPAKSKALCIQKRCTRLVVQFCTIIRVGWTGKRVLFEVVWYIQIPSPAYTPVAHSVRNETCPINRSDSNLAVNGVYISVRGWRPGNNRSNR